ncbi:hypothetical protein F8M41_011740 [Gigaspora margarita]|uniref:Uncharacterized protein n=1 Tax=Gigaspora margarita TaxID=4874 RepID=A0A8H4EV35_GIGMA|nr:hypothetical protein F8M41_011740 [Gigaspora margarita]
MSSSVKFAKNCYDCFIDKQGCESESPGTFRCKRCKGKNKWCWFLCEKCESKNKEQDKNKEFKNKKRFNPCDDCAMIKTDPEIYEIIPKVFLRHPKNSSITDIEITPDISKNINDSMKFFNSNNQPITIGKLFI